MTSCTGWRKLIGCLKLHVIYRKRASNYMALWRKMSCEDKASYDSTPPRRSNDECESNGGNSHNSALSWFDQMTSCRGWRRLVGCLKLQVIYRKRATNYMALLSCRSNDECRPNDRNSHNSTLSSFATHGGDQTSNIWISRFYSVTVNSFEWRGLCWLTWNPVWNFGDSRDTVFDMYGDSCENLLEILAVVIISRSNSSVCGSCRSDDKCKFNDEISVIFRKRALQLVALLR